MKVVRSILLILDDTYSMMQERRFDEAKGKAKELLRGFSATSEVSLFTLSDRFLTPYLPLDTILKILDTISCSYFTPRLKVDRIEKQLSVARYEREIYLLTDLQRNCLPLLQDVARIASRVYVIDVGSDENLNCGITSVYLKERLALPLEANHIAAEVKNYSGEEVRLRIELTLKERLSENGPQSAERRESQEILLRPREVKEVLFATELKGPGDYWGKVEILTPFADFAERRPAAFAERRPADSLLVDNVRFFSFKKANRIPVLLVYGDKEESIFLEKALATPISPFHLKVLSLSAIRSVNLSTYKVVILLNLTKMSSEDKGRIVRYLREGGAIFLVIYSLPERNLWDEYYTYEGNNQEEGFLVIEKLDTLHPVFEVIKDDMKTPKFFSNAVIRPHKLKVLASLTGGIPLLLEGKEERVVLFTTLFLPEATDLVYKGVFIPFLYRTIFYLADNYEKDYLCGDTFTVPLTSPVAVVKGPQGFWQEEGEIKEGRCVLKFGKTSLPGLYEVMENKIPVNPDPREGDLTRVSKEDLAKLKVRVISDFGKGRIDLAPVSLYLAFLFILLEFFFLIL